MYEYARTMVEKLFESSGMIKMKIHYIVLTVPWKKSFRPCYCSTNSDAFHCELFYTMQVKAPAK